MKRMQGSAAARYAEHATDAIAPLVVAAGASITADPSARLNRILETLVTYCEQFPKPAQQRFIKRAAIAIEKRQIASARTSERHLARRLHARTQPTELAATRGISATVEPNL